VAATVVGVLVTTMVFVPIDVSPLQGLYLAPIWSPGMPLHPADSTTLAVPHKIRWGWVALNTAVVIALGGVAYLWLALRARNRSNIAP
jgi:hypothetical protein